MASYDSEGPQLYLIEPGGTAHVNSLPESPQSSQDPPPPSSLLPIWPLKCQCQLLVQSFGQAHA